MPPVDEVEGPEHVGGSHVPEVVREPAGQRLVAAGQVGVALQQTHGPAPGKLVLQGLMQQVSLITIVYFPELYEHVYE